MSSNQISQYQIPSFEEMNRRFAAIEDLWKDFLISEGERELNYHIHKPNMFEVIKRLDQRLHYFKVFHDLQSPCEYKYIAIQCFWINTLKPFIVTDENSAVYSCPNEMFSFYLIISTIKAIFDMYRKGEKFIYPSKERIHDILYDFKYCSLSREAMISFVETFADTYGVGIDFILSKRGLVEKKLKNRITDIWDMTSDV